MLEAESVGGRRHELGATMQISVLGPVRVHRDGEWVNPGPQLQRLLASLVAEHGSVISSGQLVEQLWNGDAPASATGNLRSYVTRVRQLVAQSATIKAQGDGYVLELGDAEIDADAFEADLMDARAAFQVSDFARARELLDRALGRWHGEPYGDLYDEEWLRPEAVRLRERQIEAEELLVATLIGGEDVDEAISMARSLVDRQSLRERPHELLMRALHLAGRSADAARAFQQFRIRLGAETGLEPSPDLFELEGRIVRGDLVRAAPIPTLRGYEIGELIGRGAFARVYRAVQPGLGRDVAIKIVGRELADEIEFVRVFEHEARMAASVEHPHVVPLYDFWREPGRAFLVMRHLRGGSLAEAIRTSGPLSRERVARVLGEIGEALHAAHVAGVVHRDIRPDNVLLDDAGAAYLADFGIAAGLQIDRDDRLLHYAAPELLRREEADPATDIHSLGVVVFELLTGRVPFLDTPQRSELVRRQLDEPIPPVVATRTDLPSAIDDVLARATSKVPADRYPSVPEFVDDVVTVLSRRAAGPRRTISRDVRNPYLGLHAFTEADAGLFFGREQLVAELVDAVERTPLVVVVGPSGSGKSSAVQAGLLPAIRRGAITGSQRWLVTSMRPGDDPIAAFEAALLRVAVNPPTSLRAQLAEDGGLLRAVRRVVPGDDAVVCVVVDQFEEVFTHDSSEPMRERFLDELGRAIGSADSPLRVVATLRADHYDAPLANRSLAQAVTDGTVTVRPMSPADIERAIVAPAQTQGVEVERDLVTELVAGVTDRPSSLPLLQFALTEAFERRVADVMLIDVHRSLGGLTGAVAARAERIVDHGDEADEERTQAIFTRLVDVEVGSDGDLRRRVSLASFGTDERSLWLIDEFVTARLLSLGRDERTGEAVVEVAHEALLRDWPRLRTWTDEAGVDLRLHRRITRATTEWTAADREHGLLARGGWLDAVADLARRRPAWLNETEHEWLARSREAVEAEAQRERRTHRRRGRLLVALAGLLTVSVVTAVVALVLRNRAERSERAALARELALETEQQAARDPELATLLAIETVEAFRAANLDLPTSLVDTLRMALVENRVVERLSGGMFVQVSPDGSTIVTSGGANDIAVWDIDALVRVDTVPAPEGRELVSAGYVGSDLIALTLGDGLETVWLRDGDEWREVALDVELPEFADSWITGDDDWFLLRVGEVLTASRRNGATVARASWSVPVQPESTVDMTTDGRVAYVDRDDDIVVADVTSGAVIKSVGGLNSPEAVAFSPDGTRLAAAQSDGFVALYDAWTDDSSPVWGPVPARQNSLLTWASAGESLLVEGRTGVVELDASDGTERSYLPSIVSSLAGIQLAPIPDSSLVFAAARGEMALAMLDLEQPRPGRDVVARFEVPVDDARWLEVASGDRLVALGMSDAVVVDAVDGRIEREVMGLPFGQRSAIRDANGATIPVMNLDGSFVASPDLDGRSILWSTETGEQVYVAPDGWDIRAVGNSGHRVMIFRNATATAAPRGRIVDERGVGVDIEVPNWIFRGYFTPDDGIVMLKSGSGSSGAWDADTGERVVQFEDSSVPAYGHFDLSDDGTTMVIDNPDGSFSVLDPEVLFDTGSIEEATLRSVESHETFLNPIVMSPDGTLTATVAQGEPVRIWDTATGLALGSFPVDAVGAGAAFHPTEPLLYVADGSTITVHTLDVDALVELARADVSRQLTEPECERFLRRGCGSE